MCCQCITKGNIRPFYKIQYRLGPLQFSTKLAKFTYELNFSDFKSNNWIVKISKGKESNVFWTNNYLRFHKPILNLTGLEFRSQFKSVGYWSEGIKFIPVIIDLFNIKNEKNWSLKKKLWTYIHPFETLSKTCENTTTKFEADH